MATLYLYVDSSNVIQHAQYGAVSIAPTGLSLQTIDDSSTNALYTLGNPSNYEWNNGVIVARPIFTLGYANNTVTATLENAPSSVPTSCVFSVAGQSYTANVSTTSPYVATLSLGLHSSLSNSQVDVSVSATGCVSSTLNIGGNSQTQVALQVYTPSGGVPTVAPSGTGSKAFLQAYYAMLMPVPQEVSDLATLLGMGIHTLYDIVLPALTSGSTPLATLDANQKNALADITNVILPSIKTTLENAAPVPASGSAQAYDIHYASVRQDYPTVAQALEGYASDLATIPNLA